MNEKNTSHIIKQSLRSPSEQFTDEVMKKVELETVPVRKTRWVIILLAFGCAVCLLLMFLISLPDFTLFNRQIDISPLFIQVPGVLFIAYEIRKLKEICKNIGHYKKLIPSH